MKSSLSIFAQKYIRKYKDTYFILQNKYLRNSIGAKILRDDCAIIILPNENYSHKPIQISEYFFLFSFLGLFLTDSADSLKRAWFYCRKCHANVASEKHVNKCSW